MSDTPQVSSRTIDFGRMGMKERFKFAVKSLLGMKETTLAGVNVERPEDLGFRRISSRSDKELSPAKWQKQMAVAHFLWLQNPMGARIIELLADFVVGDGFNWEAEDPEVSEIINRFWTDPDNNLDLTQFDRYTELILFGVWAPRAFVNPHNGHVKLGPIDPAWIVEVIGSVHIAGRADFLKVSRLRPLHAGLAEAEKAKLEGKKESHPVDDVPSPAPSAGAGIGSITDIWKVIARDDDPKSETVGLLKGEVFYFASNKLSFLLQGMSDLFRIADWVDAFDQFIFGQMERINFLNAHIWDITIVGAEKEEVQERADDLAKNPPKPGTARVHNEKETWAALAPKLNAAEVEQISKTVKMLILGSIGIPEHWFAEGGDVNRATAAEMAGPIIRKLKRKQAQWVEVLRVLLQFQIDQAIAKKRLSKVYPEGHEKAGQPRDMSFKIIPHDISAKDVFQFIESLDKLTTTLANAVAEGFVERSKAAELWSNQASEVGVEVEAPTNEEVDANKKKEDADAEAKVTAVAAEPYTKPGANGKKDGVPTAT